MNRRLLYYAKIISWFKHFVSHLFARSLASLDRSSLLARTHPFERRSKTKCYSKRSHRKNKTRIKTEKLNWRQWQRHHLIFHLKGTCCSFSQIPSHFNIRKLFSFLIFVCFFLTFVLCVLNDSYLHSTVLWKSRLAK